MIDEQIVHRGVCDRRLIAAMRSVDRSLFVPTWELAEAYSDRALPISHGQTISQPYIVAYMTELLAVQPAHRVLEIGTGTGYQTAILSRLAGEVWSVELLPELAATVSPRLERLGCDNVHLCVADGFAGLPGEAPFDRIIVTAAPLSVPATLRDQLAAPGRLVVPVGLYDQALVVVDRLPDGSFTEREDIGVRFVPLVHGQA